MSDVARTREALYSYKPLEFDRLTPEQVQLRAEAFSQSMQSRRSVRHFWRPERSRETLPGAQGFNYLSRALSCAAQ